MNKYKVYVYAICKNESKFIDRWVKSMNEADEIFVLDTGSSDNSIELLLKNNVNVKQMIISPWRFDVARNYSLDMVPNDADICVCTDIDEVFHSGWRKKVEDAWKLGANRLNYRYTWNFLENGDEGSVFWISKIHSRFGFKWVHPVHEVLETKMNTVEREAVGVQLDHHADDTKSRGQYLPLLELSVKENPNDDRNVHYLGREYMFYQMWDKSIETLKKHLALSTATWKDERCASMRYISKSYLGLNNYDDAYSWILRAIAEAPYLRDPWVEAAELQMKKNNWEGVLYFAKMALNIKERSKSYMNSSISWGAKPYDLVALASYYLGLYNQAYEYGKIALSYEKDNDRLIKNLEFYRNKV